MATSGGQPGNKNGVKGKEWTSALRRALAHRGDGDYRHALYDLATLVVDKAYEGDQVALREIADREDGKPHQSSDVALSGDLTIRPIDYSQAKDA